MWSLVVTLVVGFASALLGCCCGSLRGAEVNAMEGFSWVIEDELAGMPRPGRHRSLAHDLEFIAGQGIDLLVSLTEEPPDPDEVAAHGMRHLHLPVVDFTPPSQAQLGEFVAAANETIGSGGQVGVHCAAGKGRTGTFLAAFLVSRGMKPAEAIAEVRRLRPGSVETAEQEKAVEEYYNGLVEGGGN
jgi:atypical dual specificity phosphatase